MVEPKIEWRECSDTAVATVRRLCASADTTAVPLADVGPDWPLKPLGTVTRPDGTLILWRNPREWLVLGDPAQVASVVQQFAPSRNADWAGVNLSEALAVIELTGTGLTVWLSRLTDAQSLPACVGQATGARLADAAVTLVMLDAARYWVIIERPWVRHVLGWFKHTIAASGTPVSAPEG